MNRTFTGLALLLWIVAGGCSPKTTDSGDSAAETTSSSSTGSSSTGTSASSPTSTSSSSTSSSTSSNSSTSSTSTRPTGPDGGPPDRTPCETDDDCVDACPPDSLGCICHETPRDEMLCVPTCVTADDCPETPEGAMICDEEEGICIREGGGGPGGGPGT